VKNDRDFVVGIVVSWS